MDQSAADCAEAINSTDCLLRVLLSVQQEWSKREDDEYNWDPMTFGFTVAIAAFAAIFALIAVVQASLASGASGRRKLDKRALGEWAQMAKSEWKWFTLTSLYTTVTPMLTDSAITILLEGLPKRKPKPFISLFKKSLMFKVVRPLSFWVPLMLFHIYAVLGGFALFFAYPAVSLEYRRRKWKAPHENLEHPYAETIGKLPGFTLRFYEAMLVWVPLTPLLLLWPIYILYLAISTPLFIVSTLLGQIFKYQFYQGLNPFFAGAAWVGFLSEVGLGDIPPDAFEEFWHAKRKTANCLPDDLLAVPADGQVGVVITLLAVHDDQTTFASGPSSNLPTVVGRNYRFQFLEHPNLGTIGAYRGTPTSPWTPYWARARKPGEPGIRSNISGVMEIAERLTEHNTESDEKHLPAIRTALDYARGFTTPRRASPRPCETSHPVGPFNEGGLPELFNSPTTARQQKIDPERFKRRTIPPWVFLLADIPEKPPPVYPRAMMESSDILPALIAGSGFWRAQNFAAKGRHTLGMLLGKPSHPEGFGCEVNSKSSELWICNLIFYGCGLLAHDMTRFDHWFKDLFRQNASAFRFRVQQLAQVVDTWLQERSGMQPDVPCRTASLVLRARGFLVLGRDLGYDESKGGDGLHQALADYFHKQQREEPREVEAKKKLRQSVRIKARKRRAKERHCVADLVADDQLRRVVEQFAVSPKYVEFRKRNQIKGSLSTLLPILAQRFTIAEKEIARGEYRPSEEQRIEDVLIFRCLLVTILFRTALDNSDLLLSGAWDQVIPLL